MGGSSSQIDVAVIDLRNKEQDFSELKGTPFKCHYYSAYKDFLSNQSLKDLNYVVIRQKIEDPDSAKDIFFQKKIKESSLAYQRYQNKKQLSAEFDKNNSGKKQPLLRELLISYIRKYSLQRLLIYIYVEDSRNFKLPEYQQPYITLITDSVKTIKNHLLKRPKGAQPAIFKFRRMVKDLFRRTVIKILDTEPDKKKRKQLSKQWQLQLGQKITFKYELFDEDDFKQDLISNYYDYIVVNSSKVMASVQDMKKEHKFQSKLIYFGKIEHYGFEEYGKQTEEKLEEIKQQLWMFSDSINIIAQSIKNCTDIRSDLTEIIPNNTVIYSRHKYSDFLLEKFQKRLLEVLKKGFGPEIDKRAKSSSITAKNWQQNLNIKIVSEMNELKKAFNRSTFSYLITFDCTIQEIEDVKVYLWREKYDKRVYMYNADLDQESSLKIKDKIEKNDNKEVEKFLIKRAEKVAEKAGFRIKFQMGPIDEITTFNLSDKDRAYFGNKLGLITYKIRKQRQQKDLKKRFSKKVQPTQPKDLLRPYLALKNENENMIYRQNIINGFCLVLGVRAYLDEWKPFVKKDEEIDPDSYLKHFKIIVYDEKIIIEGNWNTLQQDLQQQKIALVHYNINKISQFLQIVQTPRINLTIFIKKSLPNFFKANKQLEQCKFGKIQLIASIVSKGALLKQIFQDENFKLSKHHKLHFLTFRNTNFSMEKSISILHSQFLYRYSFLWRTGYPIIEKEGPEKYNYSALQNLIQDIKSCLYKCKSYSLLNVSEEEFQYFYINRLDQCKTYLDLQINIMYIISLPHGLSYILQLIFEDPISTCLVPKVFSALIVALIICFCSFQDEVINKRRLVVFLNDSQSKDFQQIIQPLKIGDVLFNRCFTFASNDQGGQQNFQNHCLFFEFDNIPMLSQTHIKNYLYLQPFSFYKESTEYLIAPYTEFTVKNIQKKGKGKDKIHITLAATKNSKKGFISKVFSSNQINQSDFFNLILKEARLISQEPIKQESDKIKKIKSLYKKVESIGMFEEKIELVKSIIQGSDYKKFIQAIGKKQYMTAVGCLKSKENSQKNTLQIQATHFKKMLGVQKAMLYYTLGDYETSILQLDKVIKYLSDQSMSNEEDWIVRQINNYKRSVYQLYGKRQKYLNRMQKVKKWKIQINHDLNGNQQVEMSSKEMTWNADYDPNFQEFYIQSHEQNSEKLYAFSGIPAFGSLATDFPQKSEYETQTERNQNVRQTSMISRIKDSQFKQESSIMSPTRGKRVQSPSKVIINRQIQQVPEQKQKQQQKQSLMVDSRCIKVKSEKEEEIQEGQQKSSLQSDVHLGVDTIQWQGFYFNSKFVLTQKGKHYKAKMQNKHNF